jgi:hypothetical protein
LQDFNLTIGEFSLVQIEQFRESYEKLYQYEYYLFKKNLGKSFFIIGLINILFFFVRFLWEFNYLNESLLWLYPHLPTFRAFFIILVFLYLLLVVKSIKRTGIEAGSIVINRSMLGPLLVIIAFFIGFTGDFLFIRIIGDILSSDLEILAFYLYTILFLIIAYLISKNYFNNEDHTKFSNPIRLTAILAFLSFLLVVILGIRSPLNANDPYASIKWAKDYYVFFYANAVLNGLILLIVGWQTYRNSKIDLGKINAG